MPKRGPADGGYPILSTYLSGTAVYCGTANTQVTVPAGATSAIIRAAGAVVYWNLNATPAGTVSPGYVAADGLGFIPPIDNFSTLYVAGVAAAAIAYVSFYQD